MQTVRYPGLRAALLLSAGSAAGMWLEGGSAAGADGSIAAGREMVAMLLLTASLHLLQLASAWRRRSSKGAAETAEPAGWILAHLASVFLTGWCLASLSLADGRLRREAFAWTRMAHGEEMMVAGRLLEVRPARAGWTIRIATSGWGEPDGPVRWDMETEGRFLINPQPRGGTEGETDGMEHRPPRSEPSEGAPVPGDVLSLRVRLQSVEPNRNPGGFDYAAWLSGEGIMLTGTASEWSIIDRRPGWMQSLRNRLMERIRTQYTDATAPFVMAFVLGHRAELDREVKEAFSRAGLSHIMAVSGLHVGFVVAPLWLVLPWMAGRPAGRIAGFVLLMGLLAIYSAITGFSVSVNRASIMAGLAGMRRLFHLPGDPVNILSTAAFLLLLIRPLDLAAPGFQLSFGAVALLMVWLPPLQEWIRERVRWPPAASLLSMLAVTAGIQSGLAPLLGAWFGEVSWIAPASNLLVVPILSFLMPLTIAILLLGAGVDPGDTLMIPSEAAFGWILRVSEWTGATDGHVLAIGAIPAWFGLLWCGLLWMARPGTSMRARWRMMRPLLAILTFAGASAAVERARPPELEVVVLDVGQGDAVAVHTPAGRTYLIDTGWKERGADSGGRTLLPYLASRGVAAVDGLFLTHPHADHIGGAMSLLGAIPVRRVLKPPSDYRTTLSSALDSTLAALRIPVETLLRGDVLDLGDGVAAFVLHPGRGTAATDVNNASLVMQLRYGSTRILLTGDAERRSEEEMAAWFGAELRSDVLKVGHHGSRTSSADPFLEQVRPTIAIVSVAFRNRYRLPNRDAVMRIRTHAQEVAFTSLDGPVHLFSDSEKIRMLKVR